LFLSDSPNPTAWACSPHTKISNMYVRKQSKCAHARTVHTHQNTILERDFYCAKVRVFRQKSVWENT
jgi:hypothetical protein